ncbi:MAG: PHP domain-containing protein [Clostridia bacterium]|nr:PHP domain-containing protein [Clostridia bacterium]
MDLLNSNSLEERLSEIEKLFKETEKPEKLGYVNNHIHTFYSFSPYSPTKALWLAYTSGLETAGIMDHDSVGGCREFLKAGEIIGMATTIGAECRADFSKTSLAGKRINNPDQKSIAYMTIHSIPHKNIDKVADFFAPLTKARCERNKKMTEKLSSITGISLDFERDVVPLSKLSEGGSVTERHILFALAKKILAEKSDVLAFLSELGITPSEKAKAFLQDKDNKIADYDLLNVLKGSLVEQFYIDATDECADVKDVLAFSKEVGAIAAYAYLGDVGDSVTGDKKTQKFEDDYLPELFEEISSLGFDAVTYMPSRNTMEQLLKVKEFAKKYNLMEISGEDINSPRQQFICPAIKNPVFANLYDSTWELIRHERQE